VANDDEDEKDDIKDDVEDSVKDGVIVGISLSHCVTPLILICKCEARPITLSRGPSSPRTD
jgi:hypothetical protein